jgi:hypothetical protein
VSASLVRDAADAGPPASADPSPSRSPRVLTVLGTLAIPLALVGMLAFGIDAGMSIGGAVRALAVVAVTQVVPGALVWRLVRPRHGWWMEDLLMGFVLGVVLAVVVQVVAALTRLPWLAGVVGPLVAAALVLAPAARARILAARTTPLPWWWGALVGLSLLVSVPLLQDFFRRVPLDWPADARVPHSDVYHHLSLAGQLANRGPTTFPWVESEPLAYHWFTHAWVAQVSKASGVALDEVLFRFMPVLMPLVVVVAVAISAVRLSGRPWTGPVAAWVLMACGNLNVFAERTPGSPTRPFSPSLPFALPFVVAIVTVLALRWRGAFGRGGTGVLVVLCICAAGTKGSTLPLIVAGLGLAIVAMLLIDRTRVRAIAIDLAIVTGSLILAYAVLFRGASGGIRVDPWAAADQTTGAQSLGTDLSDRATIFVLVLAVTAELTRAVGIVALLATRRGRRDPVSWLLLGGGLAGALAVGVLTHAGEAQDHFARTAAPMMALGSTLGLVVLVDRLGRHLRTAILIGLVAGPLVALVPAAVFGELTPGANRHAITLLAVAAVMLVVVGAIAALSGPDRRWMVGATLIVTLMAGGTTVLANWWINRPPLRALPDVGPRADGATSRDQIDAARWIRDQSDIDDLVMTNRHCRWPNRRAECDARRFSIAAFTERQVLVEGWAYTPEAVELAPIGRESYTVDYWEPELLALNDGFITDPTAEAAQALAERGVRWVFVDHTAPAAATLEPYARRRFSNPGVDVYELVLDSDQ